MILYLKARLALFRNRAFAFFSMSGITATFGNGLTYIALAWSVQEQHDSLGSMAALMLCLWGPSVVLTPVVGYITDVCNQKFLAFISNFVRALVMMLFPAMVATWGQNLLITLALALALGIFNSFYGPSAMVLIRKIVSQKDLLYANATIDTIYEFGSIFGMGASGFVIAAVGTTYTVMIGGFLFLVAALALIPLPFTKTKPAEGKEERLWAATRQALDYLAKHTRLRRFYIVQSLIMVILFTSPLILVPYARQILAADVEDFSHLEALFSLGAVMGGILTPYLVERSSQALMVGLELMILALLFVGLAFNSDVGIAKALICCVGLCLSTWAVILTQAQQATDISYQGRMLSFCNGLSGALVLALYIVMAVMDDSLSLRSLYLAEAGLAVVALVFFLLGVIHDNVGNK